MIGRLRLSPRPLIDLARFDEWPKRRGHKKVVDSDAAVVLKGLSEIVPKGELVGLCMQRPKGIGIAHIQHGAVKRTRFWLK